MSEDSIYRALNSGELHGSKLRGRWRVYSSELHGWVQRCRARVPSPPDAMVQGKAPRRRSAERRSRPPIGGSSDDLSNRLRDIMRTGKL